jgi:hypothetical protein
MDKKTNKLEPIIVYWSPDAIVQKQNQQVLLDMKLRPVLADIHKRREKQINNDLYPIVTNHGPYGNGYQMCSALHELAENMYYIKAPFDVDLYFDNNGLIDNTQEKSDWFRARTSSISGAVSADFDYGYMLFCEEPLEVTLTPPYLHQTSQPEYGFIASVKWDISSWFRAHILIYQLWEGQNRIHFKKDEPLAYLNFHTDRPIIFKEYKVTQEILHITEACLGHKHIIQFETMKKLYKKFTETSLKKRLISEIKNNLV